MTKFSTSAYVEEYHDIYTVENIQYLTDINNGNTRGSVKYFKTRKKSTIKAEQAWDKKVNFSKPTL